MKCLKCGSADLSGLVQSFWVGVDENGDAELGKISLASETEIGPERMCNTCGEEFEHE